MRSSDSPRPHRESFPAKAWPILLTCGFGLFYLLAARASLLLVQQPEGIAWIWPPSGLALAGLLLVDRRNLARRMGILAAILVANTSANLLNHNSLPVSLAFTAANLLEACLAVFLLERYTQPQFSLRRFRHVLLFFGTVALGDAAGALCAAGLSSALWERDFWAVWFTWWTSACLGTVLIVPLALAWIPFTLKPLKASRVLEGLLLLTGLTVTMRLHYLSPAPDPISSFLGPYLIFAFLIWASLRFNQAFATAALSIVCVTALAGALNGLGQLANLPMSTLTRTYTLQLHLLLLVFSTLITFSVLSELKLWAETVARTEIQYRNLFQNATLGIFHTTPDGHLQLVNPAMAAMFGYDSPEEMLAAITDVASQIYANPADRQGILKQIMETNGWAHLENRFRRKDDSLLTGKINVHRLAAPLDGAVTLEGFLEDITERKRAEDALRASQQALQMFIKYAPAAIAMFDTDMRYLAASQRYLRDYNLPEEDLTGRSHYEVFPEIGEGWKQIHQRCLAGANEKSGNDSFVRADGSLEYLRWEIHPWYKTENEIGGIILFSEVITEQKRAEQALQKSETLLRETQAVASVGGWEYDLQTNQVTWTSEMYHLHGVPPDFNPNDIQDTFGFILPEHRQKVERANQKAIETGSPFDLEVRMQNAQGRTLWARVRATPVMESERVVKIIGTLMDISERKLAEQVLAGREEQLRLAMEASTDGMWDWHPAENSTYFNPAYHRMLGYEPNQLPVEPENWLNLVHPSDLDLMNKTNADWLSGRMQNCEIEIRLRTSSGSYKWILSRGKVVERDEEGKPLRIIGTHVDITQRKLAEEALRHANHRLEKQIQANDALQALLIEQATHDALTGLYNRRFMNDALQREITRANRHSEAVSLLMIDIDNFKQFNDTFGHDVGDQVLVMLSSLLSTSTRESDVACRYGGEEFVVILPGTDELTAKQRAELIREDFSTVRIGQAGLGATISIGVATYPLHGTSPEELLRSADTALYHAKQAGRNCVRIAEVGAGRG